MQKKESPDFRIPEVVIFGLCTITSANTLIAVVHLAINIFRQLPAFTCSVFTAALPPAISSTLR